MTTLTEWIKAGKYLPSFMRDFHAQKDLFKSIDATPTTGYEGTFIKKPNWIEAHCYVIDIFLVYMARRGYTLQPSRKKLPFLEDL